MEGNAVAGIMRSTITSKRTRGLPQAHHKANDSTTLDSDDIYWREALEKFLETISVNVVPYTQSVWGSGIEMVSRNQRWSRYRIRSQCGLGERGEELRVRN